MPSEDSKSWQVVLIRVFNFYVMITFSALVSPHRIGEGHAWASTVKEPVVGPSSCQTLIK